MSINQTLYGLKQAGHKWNNQLDEKLKSHAYQHLLTDPCAYIQCDGEDFGIMTIWIDNLLLFMSSDATIDHMKNVLCSEWQITDLGEPTC